MNSLEQIFNISEKIDCPVCGKKEISGTVCPRCESDLEIFRKIILSSDTLAQESIKVLSEMNPDKSLQIAIRSWQLKKNHTAARAAFLSCCALGDFVNALKWYKKAVPDN